MSGKRYPEEFKIQAVEQVTKQGHSLTSVAERLGISYKSLCSGKMKMAWLFKIFVTNTA